jgi:hypothetical protein
MVAHAAGDRIVESIDGAKVSLLRGGTPQKAQARFDQGAVDPSMEINYATLFLKPAAGLETFLD